MIETIHADRLVMLTRHAITPANRAKYEASAEGRIQGLSVDMPIDKSRMLRAYYWLSRTRNGRYYRKG